MLAIKDINYKNYARKVQKDSSSNYFLEKLSNVVKSKDFNITDTLTLNPLVRIFDRQKKLEVAYLKGDSIKTSIRLLNNDERITTIAQMLSGEKPTAAALQNAREMVGN